MIKKILLLSILAVAPLSVQARSLSELKSINLVSYEEINKVCMQAEGGYDPISGCYLEKDNIYIRNDLPVERFKFVFWHELGHFFMKGITDEQFRKIFKPTPQKAMGVVISEIATDNFALWMMGGRVPEIQKEFFINLLIK